MGNDDGARIRAAVSCFREGFNCSQAIFASYASEQGLNRETALKLSGTLGGGMARMGEVCGAVTGAFLVIGLKYGSSDAKDESAKEKSYKLVREFTTRFINRNEVLTCRELLGYNLLDPGEREEVFAPGLLESRCCGFVRDAAEILEEIL